MRFTYAKKLRDDDQVTVKKTGQVLQVLGDLRRTKQETGPGKKRRIDRYKISPGTE